VSPRTALECRNRAGVAAVQPVEHRVVDVVPPRLVEPVVQFRRFGDAAALTLGQYLRADLYVVDIQLVQFLDDAGRRVELPPGGFRMPVQVASCRLQPVVALQLLHTPRLGPRWH